MKTTDSQSRINGLHIMEVSVDGSRALKSIMTATYALVRYEKNPNEEGEAAEHIETHGKCTAYATNWSQQTVDCLEALLNSMEDDLLPRHFNIEKEEANDEERAEHRGEEGPAQV